MKWSIIIPCGNDPDGLQKTLDSIFDLMPSAFDGEVIVVNDGAHASIEQVTARFADRVRSIMLPVNKGSYAARNAGIAAASGDNFAFIDAGCWLHKDWFIEADKAIAQADYVAGDIVTDITQCQTLAEKYSYLTEFNVGGFFHNDGFGPTANVLVTRRLIETAGAFDERLRSGGDRELGARVSRFPKLTRMYGEEVRVYHMPRNFRQLLRKERRVTLGFIGLKALDPNMYPSAPRRLGPRFQHYGERVIRTLAPPPLTCYRQPLAHFGVVTGIQLYFFAWMLQVMKAWVALQVIRNPVVRPED